MSITKCITLGLNLLQFINNARFTLKAEPSQPSSIIKCKSQGKMFYQSTFKVIAEIEFHPLLTKRSWHKYCSVSERAMTYEDNHLYHQRLHCFIFSSLIQRKLNSSLNLH